MNKVQCINTSNKKKKTPKCQDSLKTPNSTATNPMRGIRESQADNSKG